MIAAHLIKIHKNTYDNLECKILIVREMLVLSFIVSEKNRKKDGGCIGAST
jgi:hypothetical protein